MDLSRHMNVRWLKPPVFLLCLGPIAHLVWMGFHDELGANPVEYITHSTGTWTLVALCVTLRTLTKNTPGWWAGAIN